MLFFGVSYQRLKVKLIFNYLFILLTYRFLNIFLVVVADLFFKLNGVFSDKHTEGKFNSLVLLN